MLLVGVVGLDEAASGLPYAGTFALRETFDASMASLSTAVFLVPQLVALCEAPILVWSERWPRPRVLAAGLLGMAAALIVCACAPNLLWLTVGCSLYFPASGVACGVAQAALMDADPAKREERMADWAVAGWVGDLLTPFVLWLSQAWELSWRGAFVAVAALLLLSVPALARGVSMAAEGSAEETGDDAPDLRESVKVLLSQPILLLWLGGVALCSLHDEILSSFASLRVFTETRSSAVVAWQLSALTLGGVCGLLLSKAWLRRASPQRVLGVSCWGCAIAYTAWLVVDVDWLSVGLVFVSGGFVALHYPIAQAAAYRALPGRSTLVAAAAQVYAPFELAVPLAIGWCSDEFGVLAALGLLLLQPMGLLLVLKLARRHQ